MKTRQRQPTCDNYQRLLKLVCKASFPLCWMWRLSHGDWWSERRLAGYRTQTGVPNFASVRGYQNNKIRLSWLQKFNKVVWYISWVMLRDEVIGAQTGLGINCFVGLTGTPDFITGMGRLLRDQEQEMSMIRWALQSDRPDWWMGRTDHREMSKEAVSLIQGWEWGVG